MSPEDILRAAASQRVGLVITCNQPDYYVQLFSKTRKEMGDTLAPLVISRPSRHPRQVWIIRKEAYDAKKV